MISWYAILLSATIIKGLRQANFIKKRGFFFFLAQHFRGSPVGSTSWKGRKADGDHGDIIVEAFVPESQCWQEGIAQFGGRTHDNLLL